MNVFSTRSPRNGIPPARSQRFLRHFSLMIAGLLLLMLLQTLVSPSPTLAATHLTPTNPSTHPQPLSQQALRQALKRQIRVTHSGHVRPTRTITHTSNTNINYLTTTMLASVTTVTAPLAILMEQVIATPRRHSRILASLRASM